MKHFLIALAFVLAGAAYVTPTAAVDLATSVTPRSMIHQAMAKPPTVSRKRGKAQCLKDCSVACAGDIIGQCQKNCDCVCNAKTSQEAKKCPLPT
jgi:hypothetical protein